MFANVTIFQRLSTREPEEDQETAPRLFSRASIGRNINPFRRSSVSRPATVLGVRSEEVNNDGFELDEMAPESPPPNTQTPPRRFWAWLSGIRRRHREQRREQIREREDLARARARAQAIRASIQAQAHPQVGPILGQDPEMHLTRIRLNFLFVGVRGAGITSLLLLVYDPETYALMSCFKGTNAIHFFSAMHDMDFSQT